MRSLFFLWDMKMKQAAWHFLFMLIIYRSAMAAEQERHDMRELCRSEVSGTLLTAYNDVDYLRGLIAQSEQKLKDSKARQLLLEAEFNRTRKDNAPAVPAFDLDEKVLALRFELDTLHSQILEAEQHIAENRKLMLVREAFRKEFEGLVLPVFKIVRQKDSPPGAYDMRLEYKHGCGPYEMLCALPPEQAKRLKLFTGKLANPRWCERYSQVHPP